MERRIRKNVERLERTKNKEKFKVRTLRDNLDFVPEPPGPDEREMRKRDQEYSGDNWDTAVNRQHIKELRLKFDEIHKKLDGVDAKLDFLLKYLEL